MIETLFASINGYTTIPGKANFYPESKDLDTFHKVRVSEGDNLELTYENGFYDPSYTPQNVQLADPASIISASNYGSWTYNILIPKNFTINLGLNVIHEHVLGNTYVGNQSYPRVNLKPAAPVFPNVDAAFANYPPPAALANYVQLSPPLAPTNDLQAMVADAATAVVSSGRNTAEKTPAELFASAEPIKPETADLANDELSIGAETKRIIDNLSYGEVAWLKAHRREKKYSALAESVIATIVQDKPAGFEGIDIK